MMFPRIPSTLARWGLVCLALIAWVAPRAGYGVQAQLAHETYRLENGLQVILHRDSSLPVVAVNLWYHTGPINEPPGRTGFAHLFEHLMFQGSKNVGDDRHFQLLESAGASGINGTTGFDRTNYYETVPANQLELALWLESDRMGFLIESLTQEKLDNQRKVVKNERRQSYENRPYGPSQEAFVKAMFPKGHPYHGVIIGSMEDLSAATLQDVEDFFRAYYAPSNATLCLAGDFDPAAAKALVERYFGTLPARPSPEQVEHETPLVTSQLRGEVKEPVMLAQVQVGWLTPSIFQAGDAEADVAAFILGHGKSSRLYQKLVYEKEIAQDVSAYQQSLLLRSMMAVTVVGRPGVSPERLEKEIFDAVEEIRNEVPSEEEVKRARNMLITQSLQSLQDMGSVANRLNSYNYYVGEPGYLQKDLARYQSVKPSDLTEFAMTYLAPEKSVIVWTVPETPSASARGGEQ